MSQDAGPRCAPPELELLEESALGPELDAAIREMLCACYPDDGGFFRQSRHWHGSAPEYSLLGREGGRILGHVGVVVREVTCAGRPARIAGIQNLAVRPEARRSGLSRRLMTEAMAEAARRAIRWGMLFCVPGLERFYASLGWRRLAVPVAEAGADGRGAPITAKNIAMVMDLAGEPFPGGPVDLGGRDW